MKRPRRTPEQIVALLREIEMAVDRSDFLRAHGISRRTYFRWKARLAGTKPLDRALMGRLREENARLRALVAEQAMQLHTIERTLGESRRPARSSRRAIPS
ncbi:MAG TPA: transposase [Candidatus Eisenbacteria bacterium]